MNFMKLTEAKAPDYTLEHDFNCLFPFEKYRNRSDSSRPPFERAQFLLERSPFGCFRSRLGKWSLLMVHLRGSTVSVTVIEPS